MLVFRFARWRHINDLTGAGGMYASGRWHEKGTRILYTSQTFSLAKMEVLANAQTLPRDYWYLVLEIPDDVPIREIEREGLPANWNAFPHAKELISFTDDWIKDGTCLVMKFPSVHSLYESNFLINPLHPQASQLKVVETGAHAFDKRFGKGVG
jgi:RES domain-containing protein